MINIYSKPLTLILCLLLIVLQYEFWFASGSISEVWRLKKTIVATSEQNAELQEHNLILAADVEDLRKGGEAIEERARTDLGMIKRNEIFYQIVE